MQWSLVSRLSFCAVTKYCKLVYEGTKYYRLVTQGKTAVTLYFGSIKNYELFKQVQNTVSLYVNIQNLNQFAQECKKLCKPNCGDTKYCSMPYRCRNDCCQVAMCRRRMRHSASHKDTFSAPPYILSVAGSPTAIPPSCGIR